MLGVIPWRLLIDVAVDAATTVSVIGYVWVVVTIQYGVETGDTLFVTCGSFFGGFAGFAVLVEL